MPPQQEEARPLERELAIKAREAALEQVVDLGTEPAGDDAQQPSGGLCLAELHLVEEGPAEVPAGHLGQAEAAFGADFADPLAQRLRLTDHRQIMTRCQAGVYK